MIADYRRIMAVVLIGLLVPTIALGQSPQDLRQQRQLSLESSLSIDTAADIARERAKCASGGTPARIARLRSLGAMTLPDAADYCITVMIRSAQDGVRRQLQDTTTAGPTPATALDSGFMAAYGRAEAMPADLPSMATLRPVAERCLAQAEAHTSLCYSAGYAFGLRAAHGEVVTVQ